MVKKQKTIMESLTITELSAVDRPAQEGAKALLIKRDSSNTIENVADLKNAIKAFGRASDKEHDADYIKQRAMDLSAEDQLPAEGALALKSIDGDDLMTKKDNEKTNEDMVAKSVLDAKEAELVTAKAFGALNDAEKNHYFNLAAGEQEAFLKLDTDGRRNELKKAQDSDPVVYKDLDGNEYRKSDDARSIANAKRADQALEMAKKAEEKTANQDLEKRAQDDLPFLPGDLNVKMELLKAVDGIADAEIKGKVAELLKAGNESMSGLFERIGTKENAVAMQKTDDEYERLSKEYAKDNDCSIEVARAEVLEKTPAGIALHKRMIAEGRA